MEEMATVEYKGFELSPAPYQLTDTEKWEVRVVITRHHDSRGKTLEKTCTAENTCDTREEAEALAIDFGRKIIDGECPGLSVNELL